jgi:putative SOS response-associated peptidase YedK
MCGRYALYGPVSRLRERFGLAGGIDWAPRFNVAPGTDCPVIRSDTDGVRSLVAAHWGLVPAWIKAATRVSRPINAKAQTAASKPMFRHAFRRSRVLVPACAFYEWVQTPAGKQPWLIRPANEAYFAFGGLLEQWQGPDGQLTSFAILTTDASATMRAIHERMPVIIDEHDWGHWLDPQLDDVARLHTIMSLTRAAPLTMHRVSRAVGSTANEGPALIEPLVD